MSIRCTVLDHYEDNNGQYLLIRASDDDNPTRFTQQEYKLTDEEIVAVTADAKAMSVIVHAYAVDIAATLERTLPLPPTPISRKFNPPALEQAQISPFIANRMAEQSVFFDAIRENVSTEDANALVDIYKQAVLGGADSATALASVKTAKDVKKSPEVAAVIGG